MGWSIHCTAFKHQISEHWDESKALSISVITHYLPLVQSRSQSVYGRRKQKIFIQEVHHARKFFAFKRVWCRCDIASEVAKSTNPSSSIRQTNDRPHWYLPVIFIAMLS
jgi:hypothetical protein